MCVCAYVCACAFVCVVVWFYVGYVRVGAWVRVWKWEWVEVHAYGCSCGGGFVRWVDGVVVRGCGPENRVKDGTRDGGGGGSSERLSASSLNRINPM